MEKFYKGLLSQKALTRVGLLAFLFCIAMASGIAQPMNGAYTIDKNTAASSTNFISFQTFFTALSSRTVNGAVTVDVLNGPYTEQVAANAIAGVSATNTITVNGNSQILQFTATASANRHTFRFNGADRVTIKNLNIKALGTTYSWGVHFMTASDYNTLDGCTIEIMNNTSTTSANNIGINFCNSTTSNTAYTSGSAGLYNTVTNCIIRGNNTVSSVGPAIGINIAGQSQGTNHFYTINNNTIQDFYTQGIGLYYASGVNVRNNDISRPKRTNSTTTYGIYFYYYCYQDSIVGNRIHNLFTQMPTITSTTYGIYSYYHYSGNSNSIVTNNAIYEIEHSGVLYGLYSYYAQGVTYAHNTISSDLTTTHNSTIYGAYIYNGNQNLSGTSFVNNVISITRPGGTKVALAHYTNLSQFDNNVYYCKANTTVTTTNYMAYNAGTGSYYTDFASWQNASFKDANGVYTDLKFVSPSTGNLTPTAIQIDGVGMPVAQVTKDINGLSRSSTTPDPGSYEFDIPANVSRLVLAGPLSCQKQVETIRVWVKNSSPYTISGFNMQYRVNGTITATEAFVGSILTGDSAQFTFATKYMYNNAGAFVFESRILGKPWVGPYAVSVNAAPLGSEIVKGSTFNGTFNSGNVADPDIIANPDEVNFELTIPTTPGYTNSNYGTAWYISKLTASTINGTPIPSSDTASFAPSGGQNARLRYRPSGSFTDSTVRFSVQVYSTTTSCFAPDLQRVLFIAPRPKAGFSTTDVCDGESMEMFNTSTISSGSMNYNWNFGDGTNSPNGDNLKKYSAFGSYTVKMVVTSNYGYKDSATKTVNVWQAPVIKFTATNQCVGTPVAFNNSSNVPNGSPVFSWDFGDGSGTSANANPTYTYTNAQLYMVTLSVKDAKGCIRSESIPVTYSKNPVAAFNLPTAVCNLNDIPFTNTSTPEGNTGYVWDFGDTNVANDFSPMHNYATAGNYTVKLTAKNEFGCSHVETKQITLKESPAINYTISTQCAGEPASFTNTTTEPAGSTVGYSWTFGDGSSAGTKDVVHTFTGIGDYSVKLIATSTNGCSSEKSAMVSFRERPRANFALPEKACVSNPVSIKNNSDVTGGGLTYSWDLGNGNSTAENPTNTYASAGTFSVKLIASSTQGCSDSITRSIIVNATPVSDFTFGSALTGDGSMMFTPATQNGTGTYTWTYGDGSKGSQKGAHKYKYIGLGIYKVTLNIDNDGCASNTTKEVVINTTGVEDATNAVAMNVYPNPSNGNFTVDFGTTTNVTVKITDIAGRLVATYTSNDIVNGQLPVSLSNVAAGLYLLQAENGDKVSVVKITVAK